MSHRHPPKPTWYFDAGQGQCRYCGNAIYRPNGTVNIRANWHPSCLREYKLIYWPRETRKAVWSRDQGRCAGCGCRCDRRSWEMDHIVPLIESKGDISYWRLPNLQTLCVPCHTAKTSAEATARAARRREEKEKQRD